MAASQSPQNPAGPPQDAPSGIVAPATAGVPIVIATSANTDDPTSVPGASPLALPQQTTAAAPADHATPGRQTTPSPRQSPDNQRSANQAAANQPADKPAAATQALSAASEQSATEPPAATTSAAPRRLMAPTPPPAVDNADSNHPTTWAAATPVAATETSESAQPWSPVTGAWDLPDMPEWQQRRHAGLVPGPDSGMIPTCYNRNIDHTVDAAATQPPITPPGSDMSNNNVRKPNFASIIGQPAPSETSGLPTEPLAQTPSSATIAPGSTPVGNTPAGSTSIGQQGQLGRLPRGRQYTPPPIETYAQAGSGSLADAMVKDLRTDSFERVIAEPVNSPPARGGNALVVAALLCTVAAGVSMWKFLDHHKSKPSSVAVQQSSNKKPATKPSSAATPAPAMSPSPMASQTPSASATPETVQPAKKPVAKPTAAPKPVKSLKPIIISPKKPVIKPTAVKPVQNKPTATADPKPQKTPTAQPTVTKPVVAAPEVKLPKQGGVVTFAKGPFPGQKVAAVLVTPSPGVTFGDNPTCAPAGANLRCAAPALTKDKRIKLDINVGAVKPGTHSITFTAVGADDTAIDSQVTRVVSAEPAAEKPGDDGQKPQPGNPADGKNKPGNPDMPNNPEMPVQQPGMPQPGQPGAEKPAAQKPNA